MRRKRNLVSLLASSVLLALCFLCISCRHVQAQNYSATFLNGQSWPGSGYCLQTTGTPYFIQPTGTPCGTGSYTGTTNQVVITGSVISLSPTLVVPGTFTLSEVTGETQCLHASSAGLVTGTGADCGSGSGGTSTTIIPFEACSQDQTGNNFYNVVALTNSFDAHWEFKTGQSSYITCTVRVPHPLGSPADANVVIDLYSNDSTSGHTAYWETCDNTVAVGGSLNVGTLTCAAQQTYTTTTTAYQRVTQTFAVQSTVSADQILVVKIATATTAGTAPSANMIMYPYLEVNQSGGGGGGGGMVYPGAGVAVSTGSAWTTSLTAPSSALVGISDSQTLTNKSIAASEVNSGLLPCAQVPPLTGDLTTSGCAATLPVVNSNVGTFALATVTVNAKGQVTAASAGTAFPYPAAGVPLSTGSAWGSSYTVGTAANNLVQLNGSGQLPAVSAANLTNFPATLALTTQPLSQFAMTTSAQLAGVITNETGTGFLVFSISPTLVTPVLGVATATSVNGTAIPSSATLPVVIFEGTLALGTTAIPSGNSQLYSFAESGVLASDHVGCSIDGDPVGVVGFIPSTGGILGLAPFTYAGGISVRVYNNTGGAFNPGALSLNCQILR